MTHIKSPIQKILFGSPGTGKSYRITKASKEKGGILAALEIEEGSKTHIPVVFHPEYTYGDFMGKLMPISQGRKVSYDFYPGHFMKALGLAFKEIIKVNIDFDKKLKKIKDEDSILSKLNDTEFNNYLSEEGIKKESPKNVALIIDEINRGNTAAIFGSIFQLLDREEDEWSSYSTTISDMEYMRLLAVMGITPDHEYDREGKFKKERWRFDDKYEFADTKAKTEKLINSIYTQLNDERNKHYELTAGKILLPPNFSILGTMNTSDNSIFFMDNAFKRRWDWEFIKVQEGKDDNEDRQLYNDMSWVIFVDKLNQFIRENGDKIRKIEDKQIGYWFIKGDKIKEEDLKSKLMFFLWDSVFTNKKEPLQKLLGINNKWEMVTFGQFIERFDDFIEKTYNYEKSHV